MSLCQVPCISNANAGDCDIIKSYFEIEPLFLEKKNEFVIFHFAYNKNYGWNTSLQQAHV